MQDWNQYLIIYAIISNHNWENTLAQIINYILICADTLGSTNVSGVLILTNLVPKYLNLKPLSCFHFVSVFTQLGLSHQKP